MQQHTRLNGALKKDKYYILNLYAFILFNFLLYPQVVVFPTPYQSYLKTYLNI